MFVDEALITVKGGDGGDGKVAFFANKNGPSGGDGGKGGDLYFTVNTNLVSLKKYIEVTAYTAQDGKMGGPNNRVGSDGHDLVLQVPLGTTIVKLDTNQEIELNQPESKIMLCRGGMGGRGNDAFKTSTNRTPRTAEKGKPGVIQEVKLLLKLIAQYGLMGLPNAGKSSLLNALTAANVRTANYPFTTLEPNLGALSGKIIADIPGLIEGASSGKGLGIKFLKHVEKVELLLHCISSESDDMLRDYETVLNELNSYNKKLSLKKTVILLTKTDLLNKNEVDSKVKILSRLEKKVLPISIYDQNSLLQLKKLILD